jgi:small subunit ribosomal protein S6
LAIYESMVVFSGRLEPQEVDQEIDKVKGMIESGGGTFHGIDRMGRRRLAYDIRKEQDGYYAVLYFEDTPDRIAPLQRAFRLNESVLRHIVFRKEKLPEIPPPRVEEEHPAEHEVAGVPVKAEETGEEAPETKDEAESASEDAGGEAEAPQETEEAPKEEEAPAEAEEPEKEEEQKA